MAPEETFLYVRCRLRLKQDELAWKSGVAQSIVSRVEGGADARLSTWRRLYAAMGFELILLPLSTRSIEELEERARIGRASERWMDRRTRPRRRPLRHDALPARFMKRVSP